MAKPRVTRVDGRILRIRGVVYGPKYRAQVTASFVTEPVTYHVAVLLTSSDRNTAYAVGIQVYHGTSLDEAANATQMYTGVSGADPFWDAFEKGDV